MRGSGSGLASRRWSRPIMPKSIVVFPDGTGEPGELLFDECK
jgi:hypothetical protein